MQSNRKKAYAALVLVSIVWGTTYLATKIGVEQINGLYLASLRQLSAGIILCGFFWLRGHRLPPRTLWKDIIVISLLLVTFSNGLLAWSLQFIPGGLGAIISALIPLWVALMTIFIEKRQISLIKWTGLILGLLGIVIIFGDYLKYLFKSDFLFGIILAFIASISWAAGTIRVHMKQIPINYFYAIGLQMLLSGIITFLFCMLTHKDTPLHQISFTTWMAIAYLIFFGTVVGYVAYIFVIIHLSPSQASVYAYVNPIIALLLGWYWLNEKLNFQIAVGSFITLAGVYLVSKNSTADPAKKIIS